jgi:hypothetical protein
LFEFRETFGRVFRGEVEPRVEDGERAAAKQALDEPHAEALVPRRVTLEVAELVVPPGQARWENVAHGPEPGHRRPHHQEREPDTGRSQHAHAELQHRHEDNGCDHDEEALAHDARIAVRRALDQGRTT